MFEYVLSRKSRKLLHTLEVMFKTKDVKLKNKCWVTAAVVTICCFVIGMIDSLALKHIPTNENFLAQSISLSSILPSKSKPTCINCDYHSQYVTMVTRHDTNQNAVSSLEDLMMHHVHPTETSPEDFVHELENYAKGHRAVTHHLLENIASASYGQDKTADLILMLLTSYAKFNSGFVRRIQKLMTLVDAEEEKEILQENLTEEMGFYDEETLNELEEMGIPRDSVENIHHHDLFLDFVKTLERKLERSYFDYIPHHVGQTMVEAQDYLEEKGKLGLLASLYFGSELIVPLIYSSILDGLRRSCGVSDFEARFLCLHIDMDDNHAKNLHKIMVSHSKTEADRTALVCFTDRVLNARVAFYEALGALHLEETNNQTNPFTLSDDQASRCLRNVLTDSTRV